MGLFMEYSHNFNPEGKTEIKEEAHLDMQGRFPKIGKRKTMGLDIVESWVDNDNPDVKYRPQKRIGKVILTDQYCIFPQKFCMKVTSAFCWVLTVL